MDYKPQELDRKWQQRWAASRAFEVTVDPSRPKYYCLEMFAYPSGHAHVGHVRNYIIGDVMARMKRMLGYNVLHPFGWDAFGLPAENAAIKEGLHPRFRTPKNIESFKEDVKSLGISIDWSYLYTTIGEGSQRVSQLAFLRNLARGEAYQQDAPTLYDIDERTAVAQAT